MLNGPALIRVFLVVIAAAVLTGLVQHYWIFDSSPPETPKPVARATAQSQPVRRAEPPPVKPAPQPVAPAQAAPTPQPAPAPTEPVPQAQAFAPAPESPPETRNAAPMPPPIQAAPEPPARPQPQSRPSAPAPPPAAQAARTEPAEDTAAQEEIADARAVDLVDLNTGTLADLNGLKGGGAIGRAIIQHRPYASTDQLLSKRVLSRAIYQRIRDQVTVR